MERARLQTGSLLKLRTGSGVWHAEGIGEDEIREGKAGTEMRGVLFWVNLARKDKGVEPSAQLLNPQEVPVRQKADAIVRVLVGEGSPVELGTPGLILDVELPRGGAFSSPVPSEFNGFVYMLEGEASFGANSTAGEPLADCRSRSGWRAYGGRCAARDALHAHGREALRRDGLSSTDRTWTDAISPVRCLRLPRLPLGWARTAEGWDMTGYGHPITFGLSLWPMNRITVCSHRTVEKGCSVP